MQRQRLQKQHQSRITTGRVTGLLLAALVFLGGSAPVRAQVNPPLPERAFAEAFQAYSGRLYAQAASAFAVYRGQYPRHLNVPEALYYEAESNLALGRDARAVSLLELFRRSYPAHPLAYQARLALGKFYYDRADYPRSLAFLDELVALHPPAEIGSKALYWMGEAALARHDQEAAIGYYRRATVEYPHTSTVPRALLALGLLEVEMSRYDSAAVVFQRLVNEYPESPYARNIGLALAEAYYETGDYARTVSEIETRLPSLDPSGRERASFLLAEAHQHLGDYRQAEDLYQPFVESRADHPYHRPALYGMGWTYLRQGNYGRAADLFAQARAGSSDALAERATYHEAVARNSNKRPKDAIGLYQEFLNRWPEGALAPNARYELGLVQYAERQWADADSTLGALLSEHPDTPLRDDALFWRANVRVALGDYRGAVELYDQLVASATAPAAMKEQAAFQQAWVLYRSGAYLAAAAAFADFVADHPASAVAPDASFWEAESHFQAEQYDRARALLDNYLQRYPRHEKQSAALYTRGWILFRQRRYPEAINAFDQFLSASGSGVDVYRDDALLRMGDSYYALKQYDQAVSMYRRVTGEQLDYALFQMGQSRSNEGDNGAAREAFQRIVDQYPSSEWRQEALYNLGYLHFLDQEYDAAMAAYERVIEEAPNDPIAARAQYAIGDALFNAGRLSEAAGAYREVLQRFPGSPIAAEAATSIQYTLMASGGDDADPVVEEFIARNPGSPVVEELRFREAEVKYQAGQLEEALADFQAFAASSKSEQFLLDAFYYQGLIFDQLGRHQDAVIMFRRIIDGFPNSQRRFDAARRLGEMYIEMERYGDALAVFRDLEQMAAGNAPLVAEAYYGQSLAMVAMGRSDDAEEMLREVFEEASDAPEAIPALMGLARLYEAEKRLPDAVRAYHQVIERSRDERGAEALLRLGTMLRTQGDPQSAIQELLEMPALYPAFPNYIAQALLEQARAFRELGQRDDADRLFDRVTRDFPGSPYADAAAREKQAR